jgi:dihydroorotate dehydrogenase (fumarate)
MSADLHTRYLGLELDSPFVPSSSPLSKDLGMAKTLEDHGASALVMYSLFEEEIEVEESRAHELAHFQDIGHGEASSYLPVHDELPSRRDEYLEQLRRLKESLDIPVIASLNGTSPGGWVRHAKSLQQAGADALELNVYHVAADINETSEAAEQRVVDILRGIRSEVSLPVAVKLSPQYSSIGNLVQRLEAAGADGVALINRFYQPDIDLEQLTVEQTLQLSNSHESLLAMRWIAILRGHVQLSLAATGGVHTAEDALKLCLCGADVTYLCSTLLKNGPGRLDEIRADAGEWLDEHEYESLEQLKGSMSQQNSPDPVAFERGNYLRILGSYRVPDSIWR